MNEDLKQALGEIKRSVIVMMKNVWNVSELALVLDVSESRVRHMAAEQVIPAYKQNGSLYFKREEIEAWQTRHRTASKDEINSKAATYCATRRLK
ncbi:MAG: helix-turn-helix domain-containing protein [Paramuribaculum sp.]|nr:helix-turn-helix domain-containing protein [Paramuribaculum sp.]